MNIFLKIFAGVGALSAVGGAITFFNKSYSNEHKNSLSSPNGTSTEAKSVDVKRQPSNSLVPPRPEKKVAAQKAEGAQDQSSSSEASTTTSSESGGSSNSGKTST